MLESFDDVAYFGLNMNDFAIHDPTKDILFSQSISAISSPRSPAATTEKSATPIPLLDQKENNPRYSRDIRSSGLLATFFGSKLNSNYASKKLKKASKIFLSNEESYPPATISEPPSPCSQSSDKTASRQESDIQHSHQSPPPSAEPTDSSRLVTAFKEVSSSVCCREMCGAINSCQTVQMLIQDSWHGFDISIGILQLQSYTDDTLHQALLDFFDYHGKVAFRFF